MQLAFGDAEAIGQRKQTRRERLVAEMGQVVPWKSPQVLIEPHYPKTGRPGRQPYALATMLREQCADEAVTGADSGCETSICTLH